MVRNINPYHSKVDYLEPILGFAIHDFKPNGTGKIITRGFFNSDQREFHTYINQITSIYLKGNYLPASIHNFLIIIHEDLSVEIYVNEVPMLLKILSKDAIEAGKILKNNKIADITELVFDKIKIVETDNIIFCFKVGWKFGLFFDLSQIQSTHKLDVNELYRYLGACYRYLTFQEEYLVLENKQIFRKLFLDGWFPFIQLLGGEYRELAEIYSKNDKEIYQLLISKFIVNFSSERIYSFVKNWWKTPIFDEKKEIILSGIDAYLKDEKSGYITSIKTLYSEIEGIIRLSYFNSKGKNPNFSQLISYVKEKGKTKFFSRDSLGFPDVFFDYLQRVIFKDFNLKTGEIDISRHSASHGVAKPDTYTRIKALQSILTLDQMYFYLYP